MERKWAGRWYGIAICTPATRRGLKLVQYPARKMSDSQESHSTSLDGQATKTVMKSQYIASLCVLKMKTVINFHSFLASF